MKWSVSLAALMLAVALGVGGALTATRAFAGSSSSDAPKTVTVFVDATFGFRKRHMAHKLTESEAEYAAKGYHFAQMVAYTENGDLEGFFVTYVHD